MEHHPLWRIEYVDENPDKHVNTINLIHSNNLEMGYFQFQLTLRAHSGYIRHETFSFMLSLVGPPFGTYLHASVFSLY